ncbi:MAG: hypothetical protein WB493_11065 [Anaeromyxobacteraceae bacterium]
MRIPSPLPLSVLALLVSACSGNDPTPPTVLQAGWAWNPASAPNRPVPVLWRGQVAPETLPVLPGGDCAPSGSVQGMAIQDGKPWMVGISVLCDGGEPTMQPVAWNDTSLQALPLPAGATQGVALAVVMQGDNVIVGGAAGTLSPVPAVWANGRLGNISGAQFLPPGADAGIVTSLLATDRFAVAGGIVHVAGSSPALFVPVVWVYDIEALALSGTYLQAPGGLAAGSATGTLSMVLDVDTVWTAGAFAEQPGQEKPALWLDEAGTAPWGDDFAAAPYGVPTGIALSGFLSYMTGFLRVGGAGSPPQPVVWTLTDTMTLSTVEGASGIGAGEAIAIQGGWAFTGGETLLGGKTRVLAASVPALWTNEDRLDLQPLVPQGPGPTIQAPLWGWWRVPGTPATSSPDWPYPGAFAEILASRLVGEAGSAVARTVGLVPAP